MKTTTTKQLTLSGYVKLLLCLCLTVQGRTTDAQTFDWVKGAKGTSKTYSNLRKSQYSGGVAVAADNSGNLYVTGSFTSDTVDFNPGGSGGMIINATVYRKSNLQTEFNGFVAKYDAGGNFLWVKRFGSWQAYDYPFDIAVDGSGNVYVTGQTGSYMADFNPGGSGGILTNTSMAGHAAFLVKYDTDGNFLWVKGFGSKNDNGSGAEGHGVAVDDNSNTVYVTGFFSDTANFNPGGSGGTLTTRGVYAANVFLAKYDTGGNYIWAKNIGGAIGWEEGNAITVDGSGNVYITGTLDKAVAGWTGNRDTVDFNIGGSGGKLVALAGFNVFVAKYDAGGNYLWAKVAGGSTWSEAAGVAVDGNSNAYITGWYIDTADFNSGGNGGLLKSADYRDMYLVKYDASGNFLWAKSIGGPATNGNGIAKSNDWASSVAVDIGGNVYMAGGYTSDTIDFNPGGSGGVLTNSGPYWEDMFLVKYDGSGNYLWVKGWGNGNYGDAASDIAVDRVGNVYMTGSFSDTVNFNPGGSGGILTATAAADMFAMKFACRDASSSDLKVSLPCGESYTWNGHVYTTTGTYIQVFPNESGCGNMVTLDLTILPMDKPVISTDSFTLSVPGTYATYQWLLNGRPIAGANDSAYTVKENGKYQVIVTNEYGCSATAEIYTVTNYAPTGIEHIHALAGQIRVYPNPATDVVYIQSPVKVHVRVTDIAGKLIKEQADAVSVSMRALAEGMYLLNIADEKGVLLKVEKVVKVE